jgi:hypothetical protein
MEPVDNPGENRYLVVNSSPNSEFPETTVFSLSRAGPVGRSGRRLCARQVTNHRARAIQSPHVRERVRDEAILAVGPANPVAQLDRAEHEAKRRVTQTQRRIN